MQTVQYSMRRRGGQLDRNKEWTRQLRSLVMVVLGSDAMTPTLGNSLLCSRPMSVPFTGQTHQHIRTLSLLDEHRIFMCNVLGMYVRSLGMLLGGRAMDRQRVGAIALTSLQHSLNCFLHVFLSRPSRRCKAK